jgi:DNA mismatch repair ATPase MutS
VAKIAGLPDEVINRAEEILTNIEDRMPKRRGYLILNRRLRKKETGQLSSFQR